MPLYEYRCSKCGNVFEVLQKFADAPLATHGGCGGEVERLISASGFQFKGSGWYATDYKGSGKKDAKAEGQAEGKSDAKPEGKSDAKGEGKPEAKSDAKSESKSESKPAPAGSKSD